jgi:hypothetical protein
MREHDMTENRNNELHEIELHRDLPREYFEKWVVEQRLRFTDLVNTLHESIKSKSEEVYFTHDALSNLNYWYDLLDIYDNELNTSSGEYLIDMAYLLFIYKKYKDYFPEEKEEVWLRRFTSPQLTITCPEFKYPDPDTESKIVLYAILYAIQNQPHKFNFDKFVLDRFYISRFRQKVHYNQKHPKYNNKEHPKFAITLEKCKEILPR